jgi:hypothetical protein
VPARFSLLVGLSLAVLSGFAARRIMRRLPGLSGSFAWVLLVGLVAVDLQPDLRLEPVWQEPPPICSTLESPSGAPAGTRAQRSCWRSSRCRRAMMWEGRPVILYQLVR